MLGLETVTGSVDHFGFEDCLNGKYDLPFFLHLLPTLKHLISA